MVDAPQTQPNAPEKPFGVKATVFTIVFLILILGVIPSLFFIPEFWTSNSGLSAWKQFWRLAGVFWAQFRFLVGVSIFAAGLIGYIACSVWLIFYGRGPHVEFDPPKVFVATGPYRWVRNPVVLTLLVTVFGEALVLASWGIFILVLLGIGFAHWQVTKMEEPRLRERFGESYEDFCRRVPRWIPRPPSDN
ncbi:MAG: isoprenylcysteine carboxylmethyltransferase family protein [Phycisphaerales bacterium]|nr:isoprenylcysteine carboxylmethyltransferase family protein [Phycisphaerales bacterium]MCB9856670.1 isoprenylcysteine carboxylmethyltransferase family protein [Phycisphaerales bacterium]MCB9862203.1 isoprenylcysteine carboxylmethyltransferase family protein [Phycisphaerales bacterium]